MSGGATLPRTKRGAATRAKLVRAAQKVFERDGFVDARIVDITDTAGTAIGSFYTYFDSKEAIFFSVMATLIDEGLVAYSMEFLEDVGVDPLAAIKEHHRAYLQKYLRNVGIMRVIDEVTHMSDGYRKERVARAGKFMTANRDAIHRLQEEGRADPAIDPAWAARTLSVMVSRAAYVTFVLEEESAASIGPLAETLARLWVNALKIPV